jgi:hypothetical protein
MAKRGAQIAENQVPAAFVTDDSRAMRTVGNGSGRGLFDVTTGSEGFPEALRNRYRPDPMVRLCAGAADGGSWQA